MIIKLHEYYKVFLSILFGIIVFFFWDLSYPAFLSYQEQFQLFLFDYSYWAERIATPGGFADYIGEFLTQFNYHTWMGAMILSVVFISIQRITWLISKKNGAQDMFYLLSFAPVIFLWGYMSDESVLMSFPVALFIALLTAYIYMSLEVRTIKIGFLIIASPVLYWLTGSTHFIFAGIIIIYELRTLIHREKNNKGTISYIILLLLLLYCIAIPVFAYHIVHYPLNRLYAGINYYRIPDIPKLQYIVECIFILSPLIISLCSKIRLKRYICLSSQLLILALVGYYYVYKEFDPNTEDMMEYDYYARNGEWDKIITKAEKKSPQNPFGVTSLNLALGMTDQIGDRMFEFFQNGTQGLLSNVNKDFISPFPVSEAYYRLGMINAAQRTSFEIMEAIPNYRKSARIFKRLAETNIINGEYDVAAKYLRALQKTLFYKAWADNAMTYLYNDKKVNSHPEWGRLRKLTYTEDFLFSDREMDMMLGLLFKHNHSNKMAFEYLMAYELLNRDLNKFYKYYPIGKNADFDHIPKSYQEALLFIWTQNHKDFNGIPWSIDGNVATNIIDFATTYRNGGTNNPLLNNFANTYWYYLLVENPQK